MTNLFLNCCIAPRVLSRGSRTRKFQHYLALLLFGACAGSAVAGSTPNAPEATPVPVTYNDGDLFLGFRATDRNVDYLINIGQATQFVNAAPGSTFSVPVGSTSADLTTAFGADWRTRIDPDTGVNAVQWAVTGGRQIGASYDPNNTLYSTNPQSNAWPSHADAAQSFTTTLIATMGNAFAGNNSTVNNPNGLIQARNGTNSYASFQPGGAHSANISFQTWNPWNEAAPTDSLYLDRIPPSACSITLGLLTLDSSGQVSFTATASPTPVTISGTVTYCSNPSLPPILGVTLTLTGAMSGSTTTTNFGTYTLSSLPSGGSYIVTPSKAALTAGTAGISTVDVVAVQRHFLAIGLLPPGCRLTAADVNGDSNVNTSDVIAIQRFALGQTSGVANTGKYQFTPLSRTYSGLFCNRTGQNFDALVFGDVVSGFIHRPDGSPENESGDDMTSDEVAPTVVEVALPEGTVDATVTKFIAEVGTSAIDATNRLVGFQGDFSFDERVVTFQGEPVQKAGITRGNWNVSGNILPGPGPIRTLRVSAYSNDFTPLSGSGTLFELRMIRVGKPEQSSQLIWSEPPNAFFFIDADLNTQKPGIAVHGSLTTSGKRK